MLPLRDETRVRRPPLATMAIIAACVVAFVFVQPSAVRSIGSVSAVELSENAEFNYEHAVVPCELAEGRPLRVIELAVAGATGETDACDAAAGGPALFEDKNVWLSVLKSMFLHGSWLHLASNMLFLWVFGRNVEARMGYVGYAVFYAAAGVVATAAHVVAEVDSTVVLIGASGAVAGVMGAFLAWFPLARMRLLVMVGFIPVPSRLPAFVLLVVWFVSQFFVGAEDGIAWIAHVAGFVFGFVTGIATRPRSRKPPAVQAPYSAL